jgi:ribosomal protein S18 acetylase RimI-like enzyme
VVSPELRRQAIGRRLVEACIHHAVAGGARRINLTAYVSSHAAIRLYESIGFEVYGYEPEALCINGSYYDALLMSPSTEGHNPSIERTRPGKPGHAAHGER